MRASPAVPALASQGELIALFEKVRKAWMNDSTDSWMKMHQPFPGCVQALQECPYPGKGETCREREEEEEEWFYSPRKGGKEGRAFLHRFSSQPYTHPPKPSPSFSPHLKCTLLRQRRDTASAPS
jgi:hypothetical protein